MLLTPEQLLLHGSKFYRLTNQDECHRGFQYKTGLNVDIVPFVPSGSCQPGGLYFFSDIQLGKLLNHMPGYSRPVWIREVTFPPDAKIWKMDGKYKADKFILGERKSIYDAYSMIPKHVLLQIAVARGDLDVIDSFVRDPALKIKQVICTAVLNGWFIVIARLIDDERFTASMRHQVFHEACAQGHTSIVDLLLKDPRVDPRAGNSAALRYAAEKGRYDVVQLLLADPRVDPTAENNEALRLARMYSHRDVVNLLVQDERVKRSMKRIRRVYRYRVYRQKK